jgi:hypothetical protein
MFYGTWLDVERLSYKAQIRIQPVGKLTAQVVVLRSRLLQNMR